MLKQLPIERVGYEESLVLLAGDYKAKYPISYADAYCVATAKSKELRIVTGDTEYEFIKDELPHHKRRQQLPLSPQTWSGVDGLF